MSYWHAFKKIFIKIGVLCSHFNNEDRRREAMVLAYYALLFQERYVVEIKTKVWVAYGERTVTDLSEMVCEVSCWRLLTGRCSWSSRPVEVESNQTETLRTISVIPCGRRLTYSKCPSQVLKIICLYFLISLNNLQCWKKKLFAPAWLCNCFVWVPHKLRKNFLDHISACDTLQKYNEIVLFLKTNCDGQWSGCCTVMWNKRDYGVSELEWTTPKAVFIQRRWCCIYGGIGKKSSLNELLLENQTIDSNQYCSQLDLLKAALDEKHLELVHRKHNLPSG